MIKLHFNQLVSNFWGAVHLNGKLNVIYQMNSYNTQEAYILPEFQAMNLADLLIQRRQ
ncbi:conserved hypothetical protein [Xenorhabdus nematophila F1]|nr:conserved hypothetical protein [Xenorhabdus nematophila F1]